MLSLRFDDAPVSDVTYIYPELESRGLVAGFATYYDAIVGTRLENLLIMQASGNEIMCHSMTHGDDPVDYDEFEYETKRAAELLRMMGLNVVSFVQPGTWAVAYPTGYNISSTDFYGSTEDLLLRAEFKAYEAYCYDWDGISEYGYSLPLGSKWGVKHITGDTQSLATLQSRIDDIITNGEGLEILFHSGQIGAVDKISNADFESFLDYIVTKVTAGDLVVMTPTQQLYATEAV